MNRYTKTCIVTGLLIVVFGSGCAQRQAIVRETFLLDTQRDGASVKAAAETVLAVQPFSIAPEYQGKGIVYRTDTNQYESDFYHEYFISPSSMITDQTRNWLRASGVFNEVLLPASSVEPTCILEGNVKQIAVDVRDKANPQAVLELSFLLLEQDKRSRKIWFSKTYSAARPVENKTPSACVAALSQCLTEILGSLEKDVASNLASK